VGCWSGGKIEAGTARLGASCLKVCAGGGAPHAHSLGAVLGRTDPGYIGAFPPDRCDDHRDRDSAMTGAGRWARIGVFRRSGAPRPSPRWCRERSSGCPGPLSSRRVSAGGLAASPLAPRCLRVRSAAMSSPIFMAAIVPTNDRPGLVRSGNGKTELAALDAGDQGDDRVSIRGLPRSEAIVEAPNRRAGVSPLKHAAIRELPEPCDPAGELHAAMSLSVPKTGST
jgi:hypothetical protein